MGRPSTQSLRYCETCGQAFSQNRASTRRYCSRGCFNRRSLMSPEARFWANVQKTESCWVWTGPKGAGGEYGMLTTGTRGKESYRRVLAHRLSWTLHFGEIPEGLVICHHCDNPPCVRPDHLFIGTQEDNVRDMWRKGRGRTGRHDAFVHTRRVSGERHHRAQLTDSEVAKIRHEWDTGSRNQSALARRYGTTQATIWRIVNNRTRLEASA